MLLLCLGCDTQMGGGERGEFEKHGSGNAWSISSSSDWIKNEGLRNVESIIYDESSRLFYATNGTDYSLGTNGFISKISENGNLQELKWVDGLNRPTGMAIHDSLLYVADVNSLVVVNMRTGFVVKKILEPIANSGLNDVCVSETGDVYVSASFIHSIFKLIGGKLTIWKQNEEKLKWANGLIANDSQLLVAGLHLNTISMDSKRITQYELRSPIKDFDGIVSDGSGGYFLTTVENSGLFYFDGHKAINQLMESNIYFGDLEFNPSLKKLYIPRGNKKTGAFYISVLTMSKIANKE